MLSRSEWVESEFKKWQERYSIPFEMEFNVKALLDLQWQFNNTEDGHVKTKADLIQAISRLQRDLHLKPRPTYSGEPINIVITAEKGNQAIQLMNVLRETIGSDNIRGELATNGGGYIKTDKYRWDFTTRKDVNYFRGKKHDYRLDLN